MKNVLTQIAFVSSLALWLLPSTPAASAEKVIAAHNISALIDQSRAKEAAQNWLDLVDAGQAGQVRREIDSLLRSSKEADAALEHRLYIFATGLRGLPVERVPEVLLQRLTRYQTQVFYWHPESRGTYRIPLFDVARAAEGTLRWLARERAAGEALQLLQQKSASFWARFSALDNAVQRAGFIDALKHAPLTALPPMDGTLKTLDSDAFSMAAKVLALRRADPLLAVRVIQHGSPFVAQELLEEVTHRFSTEQSLAILLQAANRSEIASLAVAEIGTFANENSKAREWLIEKLSDNARGASAAYTLARLDDPRLVQRIASDLLVKAQGAALRNRLLFLHLSDSAAAESALRSFVSTKALPADLRAEVTRWLAP